MSDEPEPGGADGWDAVVADAEEVADEYRDRGWDVVTVSPRDVAPTTTGDRGGLAVLLPDDEYDRVATAVDDAANGTGAANGAGAADQAADGTGVDDGGDDGAAHGRFGDAEVYCRAVEEAVLAIVVERDRETGTAIVVPLYYLPTEAREALSVARDAGALLVHLRPESSDDWVTFSHADPSLFVPADSIE